MEVNNKYYIRLTAVTPLAVGAGNESEWVKCADYVTKNGKVYVLDLHKVAAESIDLAKLSMLLISKDHNGIVTLLGNKIEQVAAYTFPLPCDTENNIKAFERSQLYDLPLVAGSSLKGALRSVLFHYLRDNERSNEEVFGKMKDGSDFMRFIKVGDIEMPSTQLFNTKIFNLQSVEGEWCGGWKHALTNGTDANYRPTGFNSLYECVSPGQSGYGSMMVSPLLFNQVLNRVSSISHAAKKQDVLQGGLRQIFAIVNQFAKSYLEKEREFFSQYPAARTEQVIDSIDHLLSLIPSDNSACLLKMSAGVGFHAITGDWMHEDYTEGTFDRKRNRGEEILPKSRKIIEQGEGLSLMGFVRISEASETEYLEYMSQLENQFQCRLQPVIERKAAIVALAEADRKKRLEMEQAYSEFLDKARTAEEACDFQTALCMAKQAAELFPNKPDVQDIISRTQAKASLQALEQQQAASAAEDEAQRQKKAEGGLAALLDEKYDQGPNAGKFKVVSFKVCLQKVSSWMKAAKVDSLPEDQKSVLLDTVQRLLSHPDNKEAKDLSKRNGNVWTKVEKLLSVNDTDELYQKFIAR